MSFEWPEFAEPVEIDDTRAWTAVFDSYDQRNENCYYRVAVYEGDKLVARLIAKVDIGWAGDDWTDGAFAARVRESIDSVAASGRSNTEYRGTIPAWLDGVGQAPPN